MGYTIKVSTDTLKTLTEDELALLLYVVNSHNPKLLKCDVSPNLLKSIHLWKLKEMLKKAEPNLVDDAKPIFSCLLQKLGI